ncbi:restriction endonuclease subunit S [Tetragenococcus halophilus]|nr:restriction endonuclease subunit S [Tetragenococcus halophilus]
MGELAESFEYGLNVSATDYDDKNKYVRITDIDDTTHQLLQNNLTSPNMNLKSADKYLLRKGDIVFARTGASVGKTYCYNEEDGKVYYAGFLIRSRIKKDQIAEFIFQNTLTDHYNNFVRITSQRSGQPGINVQEYSKFTIMIPSKPEQRKISCFLKKIDNTIVLHQEKLSKIQSLKKAALQSLFPQKNEKEPKVRFANFSSSWKQRKFDELVNRINKRTDEVDLPRVEFEDIISGQGQLNKDVYEKQSDKAGIEFKPGDILFGKLRPYLKKWLYTNFKGIAVGDFWILRPNEVESIFIYFLIQTPKYQFIANLTSGTKMPRSDWKTVSNTTFSIPYQYKEQNKIGIYLKKIDDTIALHQIKLQNLQTLKKSFLQKMFI